jgi:aryl-alcohol dehydrogenase-like predicted oxidoreductase
MQKVTLPGTDVTTSVLGFGCSALLGPKTRAEGLGLLKTAYDEGVRHFDVARAYGYGDAEGLVGEFLRTCREPVTVTTKGGLQPMKPVAGGRFLINLARRVMRVSPTLRRVLGVRARGLIKTGMFGVEEMRTSLETSLRELRTDRVTFYLLHDCGPEACQSPGLLELLLEARREGKIGYFGVGSRIEAVLEIARQHPQFANILQFESGVLRTNVERLESARDRAVITHGALATSFSFLRNALSGDPGLCQRWSRTLDVDCSKAGVLGGLLLSTAVQSNPRGVVLFSSTKPETIRENARTIAESRYSTSQVAAFARLARELEQAHQRGKEPAA